jgi:hypothetical protein
MLTEWGCFAELFMEKVQYQTEGPEGLATDIEQLVQ